MPRVQRAQSVSQREVVKQPFAPTPKTDFSQLIQFGQQLTAIGNNIKQQRQDREFVDLQARYDARLNEIALEAEKDPERFETLFIRGSVEAQREFLEEAEDDELKLRLQTHYDRNFPNQLVQAKAAMQKRQIQHETVRLRDMAQAMAKQIAGSQDPNEASRLKSTVTDLFNSGMNRGLFSPEQEQRERKAFDQMIETERGKLKQAAEEGLVQARREENINMYRAWKSGKLTENDVLNSEHLSRQDMHFFTEAMKAPKVVAESAPGLFVQIEELISGPAATLAQRKANAARGKAMAMEGFLQLGALKKSDAANFIRRANSVLNDEESTDPGSKVWYGLAKQHLKMRYGWRSDLLGFVNPDGQLRYMRMLADLTESMENGEISGKKVFDRAVEVSNPDAQEFWFGSGSGPSVEPQSEVVRDLPDPAVAAKSGITHAIDKKTGDLMEIRNGKWVRSPGVRGPRSK